MRVRIDELISSSVTEVWLPEVSARVSNIAWNELEVRFGITKVNYSTAAVLSEGGLVETSYLGGVSIGNRYSRIEIVRSETHPEFESLGLRLLQPPTEDRARVVRQLEAAAETINLVPSLASSIGALVRSIHLVEAPTREIDVSYSHPNIPFSIFVSIPGDEDSNARFRLGEQMVHEAMHLLLSMIEKTVPIVSLEGESAKKFSPWKRELRPISGIVHGAYVFVAIDRWLRLTAASAGNYSERRRREIEAELEEIRDVDSRLLTSDGNVFFRWLLKCYGSTRRS